MAKPRYDDEENVSRHAATDAGRCRQMEKKYGWTLKRIEDLPKTPNRIFKVDCVFEGETEFPGIFFDTSKGGEEDA